MNFSKQLIILQLVNKTNGLFETVTYIHIQSHPEQMWSLVQIDHIFID